MSFMVTVIWRSAVNARESICETLEHEHLRVCMATRPVNKLYHCINTYFFFLYQLYCNYTAGRKCDDPACRGILKDTIINFGENLPEGTNEPATITEAACLISLAVVTLEDSVDHSTKADLCLAMGSSLTVTPAADIPEVIMP